MSNAHGWSTGPAAALSFNTLGIRSAALAGAGVGAGVGVGAVALGEASRDIVDQDHDYRVAPHFGSLTFCEGRLTFGAGRFVDVAWTVSAVNVAGEAAATSGEWEVELNVDATSHHPGAVGHITIDLSTLKLGKGASLESGAAQVLVNGREVWRKEDAKGGKGGKDGMLVRADSDDRAAGMRVRVDGSHGSHHTHQTVVVTNIVGRTAVRIVVRSVAVTM